jgi:transcriptional antiterminator RfaH
MSWYVIQAQVRKELLVAAVLEAQLEAVVYLPQVQQRWRGKLELRPFFPGYLFVQGGSLGVEVSAIQAQPGVVRVVAFGGTPCAVDEAVVAALRAKVEELNGEGGLPQHPFKPGEAVRLRRGPLEGMDAVFVGPMRPAQRVQVLLTFLGRQQQTWVAPEDLETLGAEPRLVRERGTRGKGRRIKHNE